MPTPLEKIQAASDKARAKIAAKSFREYAVRLITVTDPGKDAVLGTTGTPVETAVTLDPPPVVENVSVGSVQASAGVIQMGDIRLSQVSRSATYEALILGEKTIWEITGPSLSGRYSSIDGLAPKRENSQWIVYLRRILDE